MAKRFAFVFIALLTLPALRAAELLEAVLPRFQAQALSVGSKQAEMRVKINGDALTANDVSVTLDGISYRVAYNSVECRGNSGVFASKNTPCRAGEDFKSEFGFTSAGYSSVLTRHKGYVAGIIYAPNGSVYEILPDAGGEVLRKPQASNSACETVSAVNAESLAPQSVTSARRRAVGGASYAVDLAEFWTPTAEAAAGGSIQMEAMVRSAVDILNADTKQSGIQNLRFNLVYVGKLNFPDLVTTTIPAFLGELSNNSEVKEVRNRVGADLVGLWNFGGGSFAAAPRVKNGFVYTNGFHVTTRDAGLAHHIYSHEVYHNFGGQHDAANMTSSGVDEYPFARDMCTQSWYTILAYSNCVVGRDIPILPYITNPDLTYNGVRLGDADHMDNVKMIRISMGWVANYLPGQFSKGN